MFSIGYHDGQNLSNTVTADMRGVEKGGNISFRTFAVSLESFFGEGDNLW
jgi:hypothetical protein